MARIKWYDPTAGAKMLAGEEGKWYNPFTWGQKEPSIMTKDVYDPLKQAVASPLSQFLASQMGKGILETPGPYTEEMKSRYGEFLSMKPEKFFESKIAAPTMRRWREDVLPGLEEGWAGALRGSGRYRGVEESAEAVSERLGEVGGVLVPQLYQQQMAAWAQTLPQSNPALIAAIQFLSESTSTGKTTLSALDPGQKGWFADLLGAIAQGAAQAAITVAMTGCWVASEIFGGWNEPKTIAVRCYIKNRAPKWLRDFYLKYGERIARFIHNKPLFKWILRPLFECFAIMGGDLSWQV